MINVCVKLFIVIDILCVYCTVSSFGVVVLCQ